MQSTWPLPRACLMLCLGTSLFAGCNMPRDPNHTLERVRGGVLRVGVVENPPWVRHPRNYAANGRKTAEGEASGVEADLIKQFARRLNARVEWVWGTENNHLAALETNSLDLVIAGLTTETPWEAQVGLTRPYFTEHIVVGVPRSMTPLRDIKGQQVAVESGTRLASMVEKKKAIPVSIAGLAEKGSPPGNLLVAAPAWQVAKWGLLPTEVKLQEEEHVIAVPPGENEWLKELEEFLKSQRSQVQPMLQQEVAS